MESRNYELIVCWMENNISQTKQPSKGEGPSAAEAFKSNIPSVFNHLFVLLCVSCLVNEKSMKEYSKHNNE